MNHFALELETVTNKHVKYRYLTSTQLLAYFLCTNTLRLKNQVSPDIAAYLCGRKADTFIAVEI